VHIYRHDITEILLKVAWSTYALAKNNNAVGQQRNLGYRGISNYQTHVCPKLILHAYLLTLPLFTGVSRVRALSSTWTGSHARETLISRTHLFLPHDLPPTKKSSTIKSWPTFYDQYFWKFPIWNSCADEKRREIRMVKVFKWYSVIDLFDTFTGKLGYGD
jgi:hypothetical protein